MRAASPGHQSRDTADQHPGKDGGGLRWGLCPRSLSVPCRGRRPSAAARPHGSLTSALQPPEPWDNSTRWASCRARLRRFNLTKTGHGGGGRPHAPLSPCTMVKTNRDRRTCPQFRESHGSGKEAERSRELEGRGRFCSRHWENRGQGLKRMSARLSPWRLPTGQGEDNPCAPAMME